MFVHTPKSALHSLAVQALCTQFWLRPPAPVHTEMAPVMLPRQMDCLARAAHRVLALDEDQLAGMSAPVLSGVHEALADAHLVPDTVAGLIEVTPPSLLPQLELPLEQLARQFAQGQTIHEDQLRATCRTLLLALFVSAPL